METLIKLIAGDAFTIKIVLIAIAIFWIIGIVRQIKGWSKVKPSTPLIKESILVTEWLAFRMFKLKHKETFNFTDKDIFNPTLRLSVEDWAQFQHWKRLRKVWRITTLGEANTTLDGTFTRETEQNEVLNDAKSILGL